MQLVSCASLAEELRIYFTDMMQGRQNWGMISSSSLFQNVCLCKDTCLWPTAGVLNSVVGDVELLLGAQRLRFPWVLLLFLWAVKALECLPATWKWLLDCTDLHGCLCCFYWLYQQSIVYIPWSPQNWSKRRGVLRKEYSAPATQELCLRFQHDPLANTCPRDSQECISHYYSLLHTCRNVSNGNGILKVWMKFSWKMVFKNALEAHFWKSMVSLRSTFTGAV